MEKNGLNCISNYIKSKPYSDRRFESLGLKKNSLVPGIKAKPSQHKNQMKINYHQGNKCPIGL